MFLFWFLSNLTHYLSSNSHILSASDENLGFKYVEWYGQYEYENDTTRISKNAQGLLIVKQI